VKSSLVRQII